MLSIRKIGVVGKTYRHLNRYRQILSILIKYGFENLVEVLKIDQYLEIGLQVISGGKRPTVDKLSRAERIRMAIEELGPTFTKLGQVLSTRPDLVPPELVTELSKLQDNVPSNPFEDIKQILETEFGKPLSEVFDEFDPDSIASASIGQVHRAWLQDGEAVAVKVQRPGIRKLIEVDLEIMLHLATLMERHVEGMDFYRPVKIVEEFARVLERELDYTIEASNMERFASQFLDDPTIYVPKVFRSVTTQRVLTTEFIEGIKVSNINSLQPPELDKKLIIQRGADLFLKQVFQYGFFHADPHPGNIFVLPNNIICFLDFGMMGSVSRRTREDFVDLIHSVVIRDEARTTRALIKITSGYGSSDDYEDIDIRLLEKDVEDFMGNHLYKPLKDIHFGRLLQQLLDLANRHRLKIPPDVFLMMKSFATVEGIAMQLDPDFDMIRQAAPFVQQAKLSRFQPNRVSGDLIDLLPELIQFLQDFPRDLMDATRMIRHRKLIFRLDHQGMDHFLYTIDRISNKISFSLIIAALIIGSALVIIADAPPLIHGISLIGIIGFLGAALMGIWLLVAMLRKGGL